MNRLINVFMERDGLTFEQAKALVKEMREEVFNGEDPEVILEEEGLEPDYFDDLL